MSQIITLAFILSITVNVFSQDKIFLKSGENIEAIIIEVNLNDIKYKKFSNQEGPLRILNKDDIQMVLYKNGESEIFDVQKSISLEETKALIVGLINKYGFEQDTFQRAYKASFEGSYLRLVVMNRAGTKKVNDGILYDFSNVYAFHKVSRRSDKLAFVNIWVSILKNKRQNKWDKHKLIIRVNGVSEGESIVNALKHYNELLTEQNNISKF